MWIKNEGKIPDANLVDVKLACDEDGWPGIECIRYKQNPKGLDWSLMNGYEDRIIEYRVS